MASSTKVHRSAGRPSLSWVPLRWAQSTCWEASKRYSPFPFCVSSGAPRRARSAYPGRDWVASSGQQFHQVAVRGTDDLPECSFAMLGLNAIPNGLQLLQEGTSILGLERRRREFGPDAQGAGQLVGCAALELWRELEQR